MAQNIGANTSPNTPILFCKNKLACKVSIFFRIPKEKKSTFSIFPTKHLIFQASHSQYVSSLCFRFTSIWFSQSLFFHYLSAINL